MLDAATTLWEIEAIKQLKARYCRYLDTKRWDDWRQLFTDDFVSDTSQSGGKLISGAEEFVSYVRNTLGKPSQPTAHQVHAPEIALTSATTATGVWALEDVVRLGPASISTGGSLPRNLREGRRTMADQNLHVDPAAGGRLQSALPYASHLDYVTWGPP